MAQTGPIEQGVSYCNASYVRRFESCQVRLAARIPTQRFASVMRLILPQPFFFIIH